MKVNSLAFDTNQALNAKASSPREPTQSQKAPANPEPPTLEKSDLSTQAPQKPIVNGMGLGLKFAVDKTTGLNVIRVYDIETGELIRQIPPEEVLNFLQQFESQQGQFFSRWL
jgi:flagellar protein FlaG